jgi:adenine phosphoribosyltransferase
VVPPETTMPKNNTEAKMLDPTPLDQSVAQSLRTVADFPKPGILFKDIGPILADPALMNRIVRALCFHAEECGAGALVGIESRGFLFAVPAALALHVPFVPARKKGKLPGAVLRADYALEYGHDTIEVQKDFVKPGQRYLIVDDVLATGGTAQAVAKCIQQGGGQVVGFSFVLELGFLKGHEVLAKAFPSTMLHSILKI